MATLKHYGVVNTNPDGSASPEYIECDATGAEWDRIGRSGTYQVGGTFDEAAPREDRIFPADRARVGEIARATEVTCEDETVIDWMKRG